jgi:uncharacterized protein
MRRHILHLSVPVADLQAAKRFYIDVLAARVGRETERWLDVLLWGHQITLQLRPNDVVPLAAQGKRHFGVTLPWDEWEGEVRRLRSLGAAFLGEPAILGVGTLEEHAKLYLADPSNNIIEIKTYRDVVVTLGLEH